MKTVLVLSLMLMSSTAAAGTLVMGPKYQAKTDINGVEYMQCSNDILVSQNSKTAFVQPERLCGDSWFLPTCEKAKQPKKAAKVVDQSTFEKYKAIVGEDCKNNHFDKIHGVSIK